MKNSRPRPRLDFAAADKALKSGDLATYQAQIKEAEAHVAAAQKAANG